MFGGRSRPWRPWARPWAWPREVPPAWSLHWARCLGCSHMPLGNCWFLSFTLTLLVPEPLLLVGGRPVASEPPSPEALHSESALVHWQTLSTLYRHSGNPAPVQLLRFSGLTNLCKYKHLKDFQARQHPRGHLALTFAASSLGVLRGQSGWAPF